jgi:hypothetical protein
MQASVGASSLHMVPTIDIDALLEHWAVRMSATAALLPGDGEATAAVKRMRLRVAIELSPHFPAPPDSWGMRRELLKLVFRDARTLLAGDELLDQDEFAAALHTLANMEKLALAPSDTVFTGCV